MGWPQPWGHHQDHPRQRIQYLRTTDRYGRIQQGIVVSSTAQSLSNVYLDNKIYGLMITGVKDKAVLMKQLKLFFGNALPSDEVKDRLHDPAIGLSGGQQQRVCVARSLATSPKIILGWANFGKSNLFQREDWRNLVWTKRPLHHARHRPCKQVGFDKQPFSWMGDLIIQWYQWNVLEPS